MDNEELKEVVKQTQFAGSNMRIVKEDDEIGFECRRCGNCCTHRDGRDAVLMSPLDIYNGAKELGITTDEFVDKYCESYIGNQSGMMVVVLACNQYGTCKLLEQSIDGMAKCKVHKAKPTICALHPLGLMHSLKKETGERGVEFVMVDQCENSHSDKKIKVSEIISNLPGTMEEINAASDIRMIAPKEGMKYAINLIKLHSMLVTAKLTDEQIKECQLTDRVMNFAKSIEQAYEEKVGKNNLVEDDASFVTVLETEANAIRSLYSTNMYDSYTGYDTSKPFLEQCKNNMKDFQDLVDLVEQMLELIKHDLTEGLDEKQKEQFTIFVNNFDGYAMRAPKNDV